MYPPLSGSYEFVVKGFKNTVSVDECPAGPAMDAAVAKALGTRTWSDFAIKREIERRKWSWTATGSVKGYTFAIFRDRVRKSGRTPVGSVPELGWARAETEELAICRAFLKANGVMEIEELKMWRYDAEWDTWRFYNVEGENVIQITRTKTHGLIPSRLYSSDVTDEQLTETSRIGPPLFTLSDSGVYEFSEEPT